jgi:hypothetical protein
MLPHLNTSAFALSPSYCVLIGEATNTNSIIFGLTRRGLEPMISTWTALNVSAGTTVSIHDEFEGVIALFDLEFFIKKTGFSIGFAEDSYNHIPADTFKAVQFE